MKLRLASLCVPGPPVSQASCLLLVILDQDYPQLFSNKGLAIFNDLMQKGQPALPSN